MLIEITGPVYVVDEYVLEAFVEIFNTIIASGDLAELCAVLDSESTAGKDMEQWTPPHYFLWQCNPHRFILWQRMGCKSDNLFDDAILIITSMPVQKQVS